MAAYTLRNYQHKAVNEVRRRERSTDAFRLCLQGPTGSGKSLIMADLGRDPKRQIYFTHRRLLCDQISSVLRECGVRYSFIAAGYKQDLTAPIQICMIQTANARLDRLMREWPDFDRAHIDEIHVQKGPKYRAIFDMCHARGASIIGYTATPSDLGGIVDDVYIMATVPELIQAGHLCPPIVFGCGQPEIEQLERLRRDAKGDYLAGDVDRLVKPQIIFGRVVEHYRRLNPDGRPFLLFAHSVKASIWWAQMLTAKDIRTAHIDGDDVWLDGVFCKSDTEIRAKCFAMLETGELKGISNRFVMREGIDLPCIGHIIATAPVGSRVSWVQMCGRALRPYPGRTYTIIQDHGGSSINHPPLDSAEPWDWQLPAGVAEKTYIASMRSDVVSEPIMCPQCCCMRQVGDTCPFCGFRYAKHARYVIQANGMLRLLEGKAFRPRKIVRKAGQAEAWKRAFWAARKNGNRTFEQIYAYYAFKHNWQWLPRDLPLMPVKDFHWFLPCKDVPLSDLVA